MVSAPNLQGLEAPKVVPNDEEVSRTLTEPPSPANHGEFPITADTDDIAVQKPPTTTVEVEVTFDLGGREPHQRMDKAEVGVLGAKFN